MSDAHILIDGKRLTESKFSSYSSNEFDRKLDNAVKDTVQSVARFAELSFQTEVPKASGKMREAIFKTVTHNEGPLGYQAEVGVGRVKGVWPWQADYPLWVDQGTGIHAPGGKGLIEPSVAKAMMFFKRGEGPVFTKNTEGQPAQFFFERVERETNEYMELQKEVLRVKMQAIT